MFLYIETFSNTERIHQVRGYQSPNRFEADHAPAQPPQKPTPPQSGSAGLSRNNMSESPTGSLLALLVAAPQCAKFSNFVTTVYRVACGVLPESIKPWTTVYLVDVPDDDDFDKVVRERFAEIYDEQLESWHLIANDWPAPRTFAIVRAMV